MNAADVTTTVARLDRDASGGTGQLSKTRLTAGERGSRASAERGHNDDQNAGRTHRVADATPDRRSTQRSLTGCHAMPVGRRRRWGAKARASSLDE
ncbi:MAG TPA: hypothetical protein VI300_09280 [Solirubrobacter sp.]